MSIPSIIIRKCDINYPDATGISYKLAIGYVGHEDFGFSVGETRARLFNGSYLLEETRDVRQGVPTQIDDRRFLFIKPVITSDRPEADAIIRRRARAQAKDIQRDSGLEITDLTVGCCIGEHSIR